VRRSARHAGAVPVRVRPRAAGRHRARHGLGQSPPDLCGHLSASLFSCWFSAPAGTTGGTVIRDFRIRQP